MVKNGSQYREKVSRMVSWGHWFTLFNIIVSLLIGSRYLFIIDWPGSLLGRVYAFISWLGHFGFIGFTAYLLVLFPLTFIVISQRLLRFLAVAYATINLTLLLLDIEVFSRFHLHLNKLVWSMLVDPEHGELARGWQQLFILAPMVLLVEMLFGTWCWQKLRSLNRRSFAKPIVVILTCSFIASHLIYIWADANFYRPITMQKANLPLSYPMTARSFLEKHGLFNAQEYQRRLTEQGDPTSLAVEYPLNDITFYNTGSGHNILIVVVDGIRTQDLAKDMPQFNQFAQQNIRFNHHMSSGNRADTGLFGLFYGISPTYLDGIIAGRKSSALMKSISQQGYQIGLFASDSFTGTFYRQALFTDFSLPQPFTQSNVTTTTQWQQWLSTRNPQAPWFAYVNYQAMPKNTDNNHANNFVHSYQINAKKVDTEIGKLLASLQAAGQLDNTVIILTAKHGIEFNDSGRNSWGAGQNYSRSQLQVPLAIHWPNTSSQAINKLTSHEDVMLTLMQRVLHVKNPTQDYSQGEDLFTAERRDNWLTLGDEKQLVIVTQQQTLLLDNHGHYTIYDLNYHKLKDEKPKLSLLFQVLTDVKRFIAE